MFVLITKEIVLPMYCSTNLWSNLAQDVSLGRKNSSIVHFTEILNAIIAIELGHDGICICKLY